MQPFVTITALAAPLPLKDVDTDMIVPAQYLTSVSKEGYGEALFKRLRDSDPNFVLNQPRYKDAKILLARSNFGCGSSREHAVWALMGYGFRVVIAPSFADIFFSNAGKNGLVAVQLHEEIVESLLKKAAEGKCELTVDLQRQKVLLENDTEYEFDFDPFRKDCIVNGYDDLTYILSHQKAINTYQKEREKTFFYSTLTPNHPLPAA